MNYNYFLDRGPDRSSMREMDLKALMRLEREAQPIVPLGRQHHNVGRAA